MLVHVCVCERDRGVQELNTRHDVGSLAVFLHLAWTLTDASFPLLLPSTRGVPSLLKFKVFFFSSHPLPHPLVPTYPSAHPCGCALSCLAGGPGGRAHLPIGDVGRAGAVCAQSSDARANLLPSLSNNGRPVHGILESRLPRKCH